MNQAQSRAEHVDSVLGAAGGVSSEGSKVPREHPLTLGRLQGVDGKALYADYVLVYRHRKLAVIEAKA